MNNQLVFTSIRATTEGSSDEITCQTGEKKTEDGQCQSCPTGTYGTDGLSCQSCPEASTSDEGATSITQCKCPADHFMKSENCEMCPEGKISLPGSTSLTDCKESINPGLL